MTGSEFATYITNVFKRTDKSTEMYEAINDAVMDIKLRFAFDDYQEEGYVVGIDTLGEYQIALPSDFQHLLGPVLFIDEDGGSKPLVKRSKATYDGLYPGREETSVDKGVPKDFCIYAGQIYIGPVPDSVDYVYQINYSKEAATEIESTTDPVPFTELYRWILREKVLSFLYQGLGFDEEAAKWEALAERDIPRMIVKELNNKNASMSVDYTDI